MNKTLGIILIALGLFGLAWGGFTYTTREKVVDIGPIHATREKCGFRGKAGAIPKLIRSAFRN